MIYIKNGSSFDKLDSWDDLSARESFQSPVDLENKILLDAFGYYELKEKRACGKKNCRKEHYKGVLVITEDGIETNIGHDCGFKAFGVKFENLAVALTSQAKYHRTLVALKEAKNNLWSLRNSAAKLLVGEGNITWAAHKILDLKDPEIVGRTASDYLKKMAGLGNGKVIVSRRKTEDEIAIDDVMKGNRDSYNESEDYGGEPSPSLKPQYKNIVIGTVQFPESLLNDYDLALIYERDIKIVLDQLESSDPDKLHTNKAITLGNKVAKLEERISFIEDRQIKARTLLTQKNLAPLLVKILGQKKSTSEKDKLLFENFIKTLPEDVN